MGVNAIKGRLPQAGNRPLTWCAPEGTRTPNLLIRSQMLYPLSYGRSRRPVYTPTRSAEAPGFEPGRGFKAPTALAVRRHRPD
jgi:hypothetical protein